MPVARTMDEVLDQYYESWLGLDAVYEKWAARYGITFNMLNILTLLDGQARLSAEERAALVDTTHKLWRSMADALAQQETGESAP